MSSMKNVLITGGAGFLGTNLLLKLLPQNLNLRATLHKKEPQIQSEKINWIHCDLQKPQDCMTVCEDIDTLFMCAAQTSGAQVIQNTPLTHLTPNLVMNTFLLEAAHKQGVKQVVFISSSTVYPVADEPMNENDFSGEYFSKYHIVGSMKYFTEQICEMYASKISNPMKIVVIRPGNLYGPYDDFEWETSHVLPAFIRRVAERQQPISVWGNGEDIKDFIYVEDFIDGMLKALEETDSYDVFNIASGQQHCLKDLLQVLVKIDAYENAKVTFDATKPTMIPKRLIDISKAKKLLNFTPTTPIATGLKQTLDWYKESL
ncbi:MAG: NAD(P)-dependent oxidoreductase [Lentisphaeraceae bacterium]|nr:NAD(P)-dependent oxidoreductase [Lentisphaeraceae bacterium]